MVNEANQVKPELIYFAAYGRMECVRMLKKFAEIDYNETLLDYGTFGQGKATGKWIEFG